MPLVRHGEIYHPKHTFVIYFFLCGYDEPLDYDD